MTRNFLFAMITFFSLTAATHIAHAEKVVIQSGKKQHVFNVEIADDELKREKGLMFRKSLDAGTGMLFIFRRPGIENFWMKNTLIPLDMIFIREDGGIVRVYPNAKPNELGVISSQKPVIAVLEINGGEAAKKGIKAGDRVRAPSFIAPKVP